MKRLMTSGDKFPIQVVLFEKGAQGAGKCDVFIFGLKEDRGNKFYCSEDSPELATLLASKGITERTTETNYKFSPTEVMMNAVSEGIHSVQIGLPRSYRTTVSKADFLALCAAIIELFREGTPATQAQSVDGDMERG
jgi:hypothetical protein